MEEKHTTEQGQQTQSKAANQPNSAEALALQYQAIHQVIRQMREIPELPSERPHDTESLLKVDFPDEGGVLCYMTGHDYPYRGFPFADFVEKIDTIKKVTRAVLSGFYHALRGRWYLIPTLLPAAWVATILVRVLVYCFYRVIERFRIKKEKHCTALRELHRAFGTGSEFRKQLRDLVCMVLEFDNAYRYRFQDLIAELDKDAAKKNISKEIIRLFAELQKRERVEDVRNTWVLIKLFIRFYLRFDGELRTILTDITQNIDIGKASLDPADKHFCVQRKDYTFPWIQKALYEYTENNKADRLIIEKVYLRLRHKEEEEQIRKDYITLIDALNTRQAVEKEQGKDCSKHQEEQDALVKSFDPRIAETEARWNKELNDIVAKYG